MSDDAKRSMFRSCWCDCNAGQRNRSGSPDSIGEISIRKGSSFSAGDVATESPPATSGACCGAESDGSDSDSSASSATCSEESVWYNVLGCGQAKFHFVPKNGWHPFLRKMHCSARNTIEWVGKGPVPASPGDCWLLPTTDEMALLIAQIRPSLIDAGWKVLTCSPNTVSRLSNKARLYEHARSVGHAGAMPQQYASPEYAEFPCILKAAVGQHGKDVFIVESVEEVLAVTPSGFGADWVLQELVIGSTEYSVSLLVDSGSILDAICMQYEYDSTAYVWPNVNEISRTSHSDIPAQHLETMSAFLREYSGICNFNYKVRPNGAMCIFEMNTRVGADLACDVPRRRARELFEKLDELSHKCRRRRRSSKP